MKHLLLLLIICLTVTAFSKNVYIPAPTFKEYLLGTTYINKNNDQEISYEEASSHDGFIYPSGIKDLTGIEAFVTLDGLICTGSTINNPNLTKNTNLTLIKFDYCSLKKLNISQNINLDITFMYQHTRGNAFKIAYFF